jgi:hypothetical protein
LRANPDERDKCLSQIIFLQKNKKIICKALIGNESVRWPSPMGIRKETSPFLQTFDSEKSCLTFLAESYPLAWAMAFSKASAERPMTSSEMQKARRK